MDSPNGMANADSASIDIDLVHVKAQSLDVGKDNHAERFVNLPHVNIILFYTCHLQQLHTDKHIFQYKQTKEWKWTRKTIKMINRNDNWWHITTSIKICLHQVLQTDNVKNVQREKERRKEREKLAVKRRTEPPFAGGLICFLQGPYLFSAGSVICLLQEILSIFCRRCYSFSTGGIIRPLQALLIFSRRC